MRSDTTASAAREVYEPSGPGPKGMDAVGLRDCFTANENVACAGPGLIAGDAAEKLIEDGGDTCGGKSVTNPSGGAAVVTVYRRS